MFSYNLVSIHVNSMILSACAENQNSVGWFDEVRRLLFAFIFSFPYVYKDMSGAEDEGLYMDIDGPEFLLELNQEIASLRSIPLSVTGKLLPSKKTPMDLI